MSYSPDIFCAGVTSFLSAGAAAIQSTPVLITESDAGGAGTITINVDCRLIVISPPVVHLTWIKNQQCADGAVVVLKNDVADLHILELKSKLSSQKWDDARAQCEGMLRRAQALQAALGLEGFGKIIFYVALKSDALTPFLLSNPALLKTFVGGAAVSPAIQDWLSKSVTIENFPQIPVIIVDRDEFGNGVIDIAA